MERFFERFDRLAGVDPDGAAARWLDRAAFFAVVLMVISAPHSIAASQGAWLLGLLLSAIRVFVKPRPTVRFHVLNYALLALFAWSAISSALSYEPAISINKLRSVSLLLVFFLVYHVVRKLSAVYFLAFMLVLSCMVNVGWAISERVIGRGVEVYGVAPDGPLGKAGLVDGDAILEANGKKLRSPDELVGMFKQSEDVKITFYRTEAVIAAEINRNDMLPGENAIQKLGIGGW